MSGARLKPAAFTTLALLAGFAMSVALRVELGGPGAAQSVAAGLVFAVCLVALGLTVGTPVVITRRAVTIGLAGGLALCLPALAAAVIHTPRAQPPFHWYLGWAVMVTLVAIAEEYFLRGALFECSRLWLGETGAMVITTIAFALMHVPLYGWHVLPLDLAVGAWLGALRLASRTWTAPAIAHTLADLAAWWLQ